MEISDRITVLRRGRVIATVQKVDASIPELAKMMVGREVSLNVQKQDTGRGEVILSVRELTVQDDRGLKSLKEISLDLHQGEILGIAGVEGNGQRELAETLAGLRPSISGEIGLGNIDITNAPPEIIISTGLSYVPEDRNQVGSIGKFSLAENSILKSHNRPPFARRLMLRRQAIASHAERLVAEYDIRTPSVDVQARTLSGGNLQKLILAREVSRRTPVLIAMQPTRGLDMATTEFIHRQLLELRDAGTGILLISTELDEILALSDRIAVLYEGEIVDIIPGEIATREEIGLLMAGMRRDGARDAQPSFAPAEELVSGDSRQ
jgi:simple sugar transport system ATP-binding protein